MQVEAAAAPSALPLAARLATYCSILQRAPRFQGGTTGIALDLAIPINRHQQSLPVPCREVNRVAASGQPLPDCRPLVTERSASAAALLTGPSCCRRRQRQEF